MNIFDHVSVKQIISKFMLRDDMYALKFPPFFFFQGTAVWLQYRGATVVIYLQVIECIRNKILISLNVVYWRISYVEVYDCLYLAIKN